MRASRPDTRAGKGSGITAARQHRTAQL